MKPNLLFTVISLFVFFIETEAQVVFTNRGVWNGSYKIQQVGAPNLEPVFVDAALSLQSFLKPDSIIRGSTLAISGIGKIQTNNGYKNGSPFLTAAFPLTSFTCKDPNVPCYTGFTTVAPVGACTVRYGEVLKQNKMIAMTYTDYDKDMATFSSSMAKLNLPENASISAAYLYWAGNFKSTSPDIKLYSPLASYQGDGNVFNVAVTNPDYKTVKLHVGNTTVDVTATSTYLDARSQPSQYVCVADVKDLLTTFTGGEVWVKNIRSYPMESNGGSSSGWNLVIITSHINYNRSSIVLMDGFETIYKDNYKPFVISGFQTPATFSFESYIGLGVLDGENLASELANFGGFPEGLTVRSNSQATEINPFRTDLPPYKLWTRIARKGGYPANNLMEPNRDTCLSPLYDANWLTGYDGISSSHITSYDKLTNKNGNEIERLPSHINTLGYDVHHIKLPSFSIVPNSNSVELRLNAGVQGSILPFMIYFSVESNGTITGIESEENTGSVTLSPFPLRSTSVLNGKGINKVEIYTLSGLLHDVYSYVPAEGLALQRSSFISGVYLLKCFMENGRVLNQKLVVE